MIKNSKTKLFDLKDRTYSYAKRVALSCKKLAKTASNIEYSKQLIRSSGSVGANYIEANEALSRKDFVMRMRICRKESKESAFWLSLIRATNGIELAEEASALHNEAVELKKIFSSILEKSK